MRKWIIAASLVAVLLVAAGFTYQGSQAPKWEYKSVTIDYAGTPTAADALGLEGWELVSVVNFDAKIAGMRNTTFYFKRPLAK